MRAESAFRAMGSDAHVVVIGDEGLLSLARRRIDELEARWSRFRLDSEVSRCNAAGGSPVVVSRDTALLVDRCVYAWRATGGSFDPTVLDALCGLGYDRDFPSVRDGADPPPRRCAPAPGLGAVVVDPGTGLVRLPAGVHLDPGGLGKGLAADLVCAELLRAGAAGAMVNLGGDLRVAGSPGEGRELWSVSIEDPHDPRRELARLEIADGAVATSSKLRRRWVRGADEVHHVIDPGTGRPSSTPTVAVSVVAREAWWAEVRSTVALLALDPLAEPGAGVGDDVELLAVADDASVRATPAFGKVLACSRP